MESTPENQVVLLNKASIDEELVKLKTNFFREIDNIFSNVPLSIEELQKQKEDREKLLRDLKEARDTIEHKETSQSNGTKWIELNLKKTITESIQHFFLN